MVIEVKIVVSLLLLLPQGPKIDIPTADSVLHFFLPCKKFPCGSDGHNTILLHTALNRVGTLCCLSSGFPPSWMFVLSGFI